MTVPGAQARPTPFEALDYVYSPSADVAAELEHFETVLGARVVFAIDDMGTRVAMIELVAGPPPSAPRRAPRG